MNKTLKEQLAKVALSLGYDVKKEIKEVSKPHASRKKVVSKVHEVPIDKKLQNIIKLANAGRNGDQLRVKISIDITNFLLFLGDCKRKGKISETDEYFCLCAVENINEFSAFTIDEFQKYFLKIQSRLSELINLGKVDLQDTRGFSRQLEISRIREEKIRKQKEQEDYLFLSKKILFSGIDVDAKIESTPILSEYDFKLSMEWLDQRYKNQINNQIEIVLEKYEEDYEVGRVLSARAAENAAKIFYERCGFKVEDVSINQIRQESNSDWKYYDLTVNDCPIDIKNSRRSYSSNDRYVEHCIPQKSKITRNNEEITIAGILSRYLWPKILLAPGEYKVSDTSLIFLGETTQDECNKLSDEFNTESFRIDFSRPDRDKNFFLPPWIFNYPIKIYQNRQRAIDKLSELGTPDYTLCHQKNFNCVPSCLAANINLSEYFSFGAVKEWERDLYNTLSKRIQKYGLSLPFIYLSFLRHFTEMICQSIKQQTDYRPNQYRRFVFMNNDEFNKPLGIYDPLYTVRSLIEVLDDLWSAKHDLVRKYKYFKLRGFHIFLAKSEPHERWEPLIAYCGGWIEGKGKCGKYPLVLGESVRCEKCKKLICPICGFCSEGCENCYEKKTAQNEYHRISENQGNFCDDVPF